MAGRRTHRLPRIGKGFGDSSKKKMLEEFSKSIFWQNRDKFCSLISDQTGFDADQSMRQVVDAYLIFCLTKFFKINSYCEIGVRQGATLSLILDTNPDCECLVIDPKLDLNFLASKVTLSKTKVVIGKSQEYPIEQKHFDFILIDGDHTPPMPKLDVIKMLKHFSNESMIWLDDTFLESGMDAQNELVKQGLKLWIKGSNGEIWAKDRNLQPFIENILADQSFKKFCVLYRDRITADQEILVINMPGGFLNKIDWINEIITDELKNR